MRVRDNIYNVYEENFIGCCSGACYGIGWL